MSFRSPVPALLVAAAVAVVLPVLAQEMKGDPVRGQQLAYTCYGCHGVPNYKNVYPTYSVPKLQGQHPEYLAVALLGYKSGERAHSTMHAQAQTMSEQDMRDIAAFLAGKPIQSAPPKPADDAPKAVQTCIACHGADGISIVPNQPTLAGQHRDYIERALHDYKNGARKNPIMSAFAAQLTDEDIAAVAEYYSGKTPGLSTAEHAVWFVQEKKSE